MDPLGRRAFLLLLAMPVCAQEREERQLAGRWTARQPTGRQRGRNAARLEFILGKDGTFRLDEVRRVGEPQTVTGSYRITAADEFVVAVATAPKVGGRFRAGEETNLGGLLWLSATRLRIGEFELLKRLD
ncbi:MAG: hypothetical protein ACK58M_02715 [Acidobacteriota bacterium]|jgi:hypothetical protein